MLERLNTAPREDLIGPLRACLAVDSWVNGMLAGRPYRDTVAVLERARSLAEGLSRAEVLDALHAHPRIGQPPPSSMAGTAASWSRREQSGLDRDRDTTERIRDANTRYELRFGHIYLVFATGMSAEDILADIESRMDNQPDLELDIARKHLRDIALLRLRRLLEETSAVTTHVLDSTTGTPAHGIPVTLEVAEEDGWRVLDHAATNSDGRLRRLGPDHVEAGVYRLRFDTDSYYGGASFFPEIIVTFRISDPARHHHVPILLSPFSYTTYRGS
jgi:hydroxyisourate hydrolase